MAKFVENVERLRKGEIAYLRQGRNTKRMGSESWEVPPKSDDGQDYINHAADEVNAVK